MTPLRGGGSARAWREDEDARTWAQRHGLATGHHAIESLTDPGSCLDCSERSPAAEMARPDVQVRNGRTTSPARSDGQ